MSAFPGTIVGSAAATAIPVFTKSTNPMTTLPLRLLRLCWQTNLYYQQKQYLLACFYEDATRLYHINLLPPADVDLYLIDGFWIETNDSEATFDDIFCHFFGMNYQATIWQHPDAYPKLPYEYVRHLIAVSDVVQTHDFYIIMTT